MSGEQPDSGDGGFRDDLVVGLQSDSSFRFFYAIGTQLRRSLRDNRRRSSMDYKTCLGAGEQRERRQRMANRFQSFSGEGLPESAFADSGYGHPHRVIPLVHVNCCTGNSASKWTGQKCGDRSNLLGRQRISDG